MLCGLPAPSNRHGVPSLPLPNPTQPQVAQDPHVSRPDTLLFLASTRSKLSIRRTLLDPSSAAISREGHEAACDCLRPRHPQTRAENS